MIQTRNKKNTRRLNHLLFSILFYSLSVLGGFQNLQAASYYVSTRGSDANPGTSADSAWRTLDRANVGPPGGYQSGDSILLEAGQSFAGTLALSTNTYRATSANPVRMASFGQGRATLNSGTQSGIVTFSVGGVGISNLNIVGTNPSGGQGGIVFINQSSGALSGFEVTDVEISGYTNAVYISQGAPPSKKIRDLRFDRIKVHDNASGLTLLGALAGPGSGAVQQNNFYAIENLYIGNSEFYNNTGAGLSDNGYAIGIIQADNVTIERNNIHDNGGNAPSPVGRENGPSAITLYDGRRATIQFNEIARQRFTRNSEADNAAADVWALDWNFQYNYVHDLDSWALTLQAGNPANPTEVFPWPSERAAIRYNIFANNGRYTTSRGSILNSIFLMNGPIKDFDIYNNTFYASDLPGTVPESRSAMILLLHADSSSPGWNNIRFRNNIFAGNGGDIPFFNVFPIVGNVQIQGNNYSGSTSPRKFSWNGQSYSDVAAWSQATGQERINSVLAANTDDPQFCGPVSTGAAASPFKLQPGSPLINRGLDLRALFGINVGARDFFGNPLPGANFDIGANEFVSGQTCGSPGGAPIAGLSKIQVLPNPMKAEDGGVTIFNLAANEELRIFNQLGQRIRRFDPAATVFWDGKNDQGEDVASGIYTGVIKGQDKFKIGVAR